MNFWAKNRQKNPLVNDIKDFMLHNAFFIIFCPLFALSTRTCDVDRDVGGSVVWRTTLDSNWYFHFGNISTSWVFIINDKIRSTVHCTCRTVHNNSVKYSVERWEFSKHIHTRPTEVWNEILKKSIKKGLIENVSLNQNAYKSLNSEKVTKMLRFTCKVYMLIMSCETKLEIWHLVWIRLKIVHAL